MKLEQFATELVAKNHFVKASFGGFAGSGKTKTASDFVIGAYKDMGLSKPVLLIDNEKGSRFLIPKFKAAGIQTLVKDTVNLADVLTAIDFLNKREIDFLMADSLSKVYYKYVHDYKEKNNITFMTLEHWGRILPAWQEEFSDRFVACEGNFVFTGRGGFTYDKEEDSERPDGSRKKGNFVKSGVKMKLAGETPFEPDLNIWMELEQDIVKGKLVQWHTAQVLKDRNESETSINGKTFKNPTYKDFQPVVKFLLGQPTGEVAGVSSDKNLAPSDDFGWVAAKREREIQLEKIKGIFDLQGFGQSVQDKQLKTAIIKRIFGTTSMTEIEKMTPEGLSVAHKQLEKLFEELPALDPAERLDYVKNFDAEGAIVNA